MSNLCSAKLTGSLLRRRVLFLWRQEDTSSLRLFSVDSSGRQMIRNFSLRQKLHLLLELLYGECDDRMRQEIKMLLSLKGNCGVKSAYFGVRGLWCTFQFLIKYLACRL